MRKLFNSEFTYEGLGCQTAGRWTFVVKNDMQGIVNRHRPLTKYPHGAYKKFAKLPPNPPNRPPWNFKEFPSASCSSWHLLPRQHLQVAVVYMANHVGLLKASSLHWLLNYPNQFYIPFPLHFHAIHHQHLPVIVQTWLQTMGTIFGVRTNQERCSSLTTRCSYSLTKLYQHATSILPWEFHVVRGVCHLLVSMLGLGLIFRSRSISQENVTSSW